MLISSPVLEILVGWSARGLLGTPSNQVPGLAAVLPFCSHLLACICHAAPGLTLGHRGVHPVLLLPIDKWSMLPSGIATMHAVSSAAVLDASKTAMAMNA